MKDLDFDELDRAVNSLITNNPTASDGNVPARPTITTAPITAQSTRAQLMSQPSPSILNKRSSGRFMDVVAPAASTRVVPSFSPNRASRQGMDIVPHSIVNKINTAPIANPISTQSNVDVQPVRPSVNSGNSWSMPFNFQTTNNKVEIVSDENTHSDDDDDADIDKINNDILNTLNQTTSNESIDSPFISGTKVDKRPLNPVLTPGANYAATPVFNTESTIHGVSGGDINPGDHFVKNNASNIDTPLPAELSDDLLSIESGGIGTTQSDASHVEVKHDELPSASVSAPVANQVQVPVLNSSPSPISAPIIANNQAIAQQYKEQPNSGDQTNAAIYDTNTYNKAVMKPARGKSRWLWVLWALLLVIIGAGVGAAVFFLLPN
jgi:hypothetical protein